MISLSGNITVSHVIVISVPTPFTLFFCSDCILKLLSVSVVACCFNDMVISLLYAKMINGIFN